MSEEKVETKMVTNEKTKTNIEINAYCMYAISKIRDEHLRITEDNRR